MCIGHMICGCEDIDIDIGLKVKCRIFMKKLKFDVGDIVCGECSYVLVVLPLCGIRG